MDSAMEGSAVFTIVVESIWIKKDNAVTSGNPESMSRVFSSISDVPSSGAQARHALHGKSGIIFSDARTIQSAGMMRRSQGVLSRSACKR